MASSIIDTIFMKSNENVRISPKDHFEQLLEEYLQLRNEIAQKGQKEGLEAKRGEKKYEDLQSSV